MMPTNPEARIYFVALGILVALNILHLVVTIWALKASDWADQRTAAAIAEADTLGVQLAAARGALAWWKKAESTWPPPSNVDVPTQPMQTVEVRPLRPDPGEVT